MDIEKPSPEVIKAVVAGCEWLDKVRIKGKAIVRKSVAGGEGYERVMEDSQYAADLWCRFYDLETGGSLLYDRGEVKVDNYSQLSRERRNGYSYYGKWPDDLLQRIYPQWRKKVGLDK